MLGRVRKVTDLNPDVRIFQNPWSSTVSNGALLQIMVTAATNAGETLKSWIERGDVTKDPCSYACVLLDPTRPRWQQTIQERVMAIVLYGPDAAQYIPNGAAKADADDRHGQRNGDLVAFANYRLGNEDFAWGHSVEDGGGSGLSADQDRIMAKAIRGETFQRVHDLRELWLHEQRQVGSQGWYNQANQPGADYLDVTKLVPLTQYSLTS